MTTVRLYFTDRLGPKFQRATKRFGDRIRIAVRETSQEVANEIEKQGNADIADSGNFGSRWQTLKADISEGGGNIRISLSHPLAKVGFWVHQNGATIKGKPLLWIPLSFADDAQGIRARDFPGGLFRVDRKSGGAPLLLSIKDKEPKYSGHEQVTIPKRFHVVEIATRIMRDFKKAYNKRLKSSNG